jgi:hypothetical protein
MGKKKTGETALQTAPKRTRTATPTAAILRFTDCIPPNDDHPLSKLDPHQRGNRRCELMAGILARLAAKHSQSKRMCFPERTKKGTMDG